MGIMRFGANNAPSNVSQALLRSMAGSGELSVAGLRALSPLSDKAQVMVDNAVVKVGLERLAVAADWLSKGLTHPLSDPLSVTQLEWESVSKTGGAQRTMSPSARGEDQQPDRTIKRLPIYLTTDDFSVNIRTLRMAQRLGTPLETSQVEDATRRVNESIEDAVINGSGLVAGGYQAYGILNEPNANTATLQATKWTSAVDGTAILADTLAMIAKAQADNKFGPYTLYVGTTIGNNLNGDFSTLKGDGTIMERLKRIVAGGRNLDIVVADRIPALKAVLVQTTSDVVEIVNGQAPTVIPWTSIDGFTLYWMVMGIMVPRVRSDYDGNSGIVIGTASS
ncbi:Encapsulating protein for peroxidase [uncultured Caudovirales phage]|uniref:Encapsulating protein for peroxidase n=1 Tax=uncultured Caudovirales phage TaxID=2100421 RepID=A0A6J5R798_9CAUD|nr:Encapsulating protein for peroxidase [uncultured Caudovirales phage]